MAPNSKRPPRARQAVRVQEQNETDLPPNPLDQVALNQNVLQKKQDLNRAEREGSGTFGPKMTVFMAKLARFTPMRVWNLYSQRNGALMAAGSAYNMFFSVAALLVAGFSILGLLAAGDTNLQNKVVEAVSKAVPNLIDTGQGGLAKPEQLFSKAKGGYSIALALSILTSLFTALGWINGLRSAMREVFGLGPLKKNFLLVKAKDLGTLLLLGVAMLVTTAVGALFTGTTQALMNLLHLESSIGAFFIQLAGFLVTVLLDAVAAIILFRVASGITMPKREMWISALIAGVGSSLLRLFSAQLIGGAAKNPILAPFAVILGLFIWFYFLSQVYLLATATGRVLTSDKELLEESHMGSKEPTLLKKSRQMRHSG